MIIENSKIKKDFDKWNEKKKILDQTEKIFYLIKDKFGGYQLV